MKHIGTAHLNVEPDTHTVETVMRVVATHMLACADDLAALRLGTLSIEDVEATLLPFAKAGKR